MTTIGDWLRGIGLGEHEQLFLANDIDFDVLRDLTDDDLKSMGLSLGHRRRVLRAIGTIGTTPLSDPVATVGAAAPHAEPVDAAERRHVTVMFCDLVGSTALAEKVDPEELRKVLLSYQSLCRGAISRFAGQVARTFGDGVLAYFGYPKSHEDDAERAVKAGFSIIDSAEGLSVPGGSPLHVRVGLATGPIVVEEMTEHGWAEETATGRTLHLASRIQAIAAPQSIVVDDDTKRLIGRAFRCTDLGVFELKGFEKPVAASRVDRPIELQSRFEASHKHAMAPIAGRSEELAILASRWARVTQGAGHAVLVSAEAGVGKSRLLHEFRATLPGVRFAVGQCLSYGQDTPYLPMVDLLKQLLSIRQQDSRNDKREAILRAIETCHLPSSVLPFLADLLDASVPEDQIEQLAAHVRQARTFESLTELLRALARQGPLLVAVEDLHWIDRTSEAYLASLAAQIEGLPILFVATHRPTYQAPWSGDPGTTQIMPSPLGTEDSLAVLRSLMGDRASEPEVRALVMEKAQGNPLFLEELSRAIVQHGPDFALPDTIQGVLMSRIDNLQKSARTALQIASVLGREFQLRLLDAIWLQAERLNDLVAELKRLQLIYERVDMDDTILVFRHALIQDAAYETLLVANRRELHRKAAQAIERLFPGSLEGLASVLAHHYVRAKDASKSIRYLLLLADRALKTYSLKEAESALQQALGLVDELEVPQRARERLGVVLRLSQALYFLGRFSDSVALIETQRPELEGGADPSLSASCWFWLGHMLVRLARYDDAEQAARKAIEQATTSGESATLGKAYGVLCIRDCLVGAIEPAADSGLRSVELLREAGELYWLGMSEFYLGMVQITTGSFAGALKCSERAFELGERVGDTRLQAYALFLRGWAASNSGDSATGISAADAATRIAPDPTSLAYSNGFLAYAHLEAGDIDTALPALERAREEISRIGFRPFEGLFLAYLSEAQRRAGRIHDALATADHAIEASRRFRYPLGEGWAQRARGGALAALQRTSDAEPARNEAIRIFTALGARHEVSRTLGD
jgi:class 3 adenylate cyclase/tetratricopeptide (TPR) repeat protein